MIRKDGIKPVSKPAPTPEQRRARFLAGAGSVGLHVAVAAALLLWLKPAHEIVKAAPPAIQLTLVDTPSPQPPGPPELPAAEFTAPKPAPQPRAPVVAFVKADTSDLLSEAQLAGAANAGEGAVGGGTNGGCDTARMLQTALRRDPMVRSAVAGANRLGKSVMLWNGDWVQTGGQEGKGLSAVREAVIWELAFVPEKCRNARVRGLIVLSLADGATRFAIGAGDWRWSDLLGLRR